jgi:endonuclease/exonuclease/phosphatase family metal-dependent hydrolase
MIRSLALFSIVALVVGCGDSSEGTEPRDPMDVTVDTFNVALAGFFIPFEAERRPYIVDAIAASDADILCLQEVWDQTDKVAIRDASLEAYPHSAFFDDNLNTAIEDGTDQDGVVPPPPTTAPCAGEPLTSQLNAGVDCLEENCQTPDGRTTSEACAEEYCLTEVLGLILAPPPQRCYACLVTQMPTELLTDIRTRCPSVVNQELAFQGQNGVMILSRHPLKNVEELVVPGTWNRRTILSATAELPNGAELDVYCNHLTPIFTSSNPLINTFPYTGQYGEGMTDAGGWQAEQELQAEKLINYVSETSDNRPAVILGDLNSGRAFPEQDIVAYGEETLILLEAVYAPAYTTDYTPLCTSCSTNPVTNPENDPDETSVWIDHILLDKLPAASVLSTERVYDDDVVPVPTGAGGAGGSGGAGGAGEMLVPLSDHFGMRSVVTVP